MFNEKIQNNEKNKIPITTTTKINKQYTNKYINFKKKLQHCTCIPLRCQLNISNQIKCFVTVGN